MIEFVLSDGLIIWQFCFQLVLASNKTDNKRQNVFITKKQEQFVKTDDIIKMLKNKDFKDAKSHCFDNSSFDIIMKIEEKKSSEANKPNQIISSIIESYSAQSPDLLKENAKVLKLIHQKMYPLNHSQKSALFFPRLKEKCREDKDAKVKKNYTYVSMEDEQNGLLFAPKTNRANQRNFQGRAKSRQNARKHRICPLKEREETQNRSLVNSHLPKMSEIIKIAQPLVSDKSGNETIYGESKEDAQFFHSQAQRMLSEAAKHCEFMRKMKQDIQKRKETFYNNANFTQIFDNSGVKQKENYTIEYLLNSIYKKSAKNGSNLPYDSQSLNKLGQFAKLFERKSRNVMLWQELAEPVLQKEKSSGQELKKSGQIRKMDRNQTIIEQQSDINEDNAYAAKQRMKNNHKRMIQLARTKAS